MESVTMKVVALSRRMARFRGDSIDGNVASQEAAARSSPMGMNMAVGCRSSAWPVSCSDNAPPSAGRRRRQRRHTMPIMDRAKARKVLADYRRSRIDARVAIRAQDRSDAVAELNKQLPAVNNVLRDLTPDLSLIAARTFTKHLSAGPIVGKAMAILDAWERLDEARIAESPALPLTMLDPVIANASLPLWNVGKYRQAVSDAATSLNAFAQQRLGRRDISDRKLMSEAFSDSAPKPGEARLRPYRLGRPIEGVSAQQEGARLFAMGVFQAIRNPAHHATGDWNPLTAFHHLVALSQVAHYIRDWKLSTYLPQRVRRSLQLSPATPGTPTEATRWASASADHTHERPGSPPEPAGWPVTWLFAGRMR